MTERAPTPPPLSGIKVLDWTRLLPGPFATMVLGDLGAQVDKLEDMQGADYLRHIPPLIGDTSSIFLALNRNKRSACLDLKKPSGREAFVTLAKHYDVSWNSADIQVVDVNLAGEVLVDGDCKGQRRGPRPGDIG